MCAADSSCSLQSLDCDTEQIIGVNVVMGGGLCVLEAAFGSLQSPDCDIEWLIGVNVVIGGVLCMLRTAVGFLQ